MSPDTFAWAWLAASKFAFYVATLVVIGTSTSLTLVLPRWTFPERAEESVRSATAHLMATLGFIGGVAGIIAALARWHAQTYATFGIDEALTVRHAMTIARETPWGRGWMLQTVTVLCATGVMAALRRRPSATPRLVAALPIVVAAVVPMTGHAVADEWRALVLPLQITHVFGAGVWLGGLFGVLAALVVTVEGRERTLAVSRLVESFSPFALLGAVLVAASGAVTSALYLGAVDALWTSAYGTVLGLKLMTFAGVACVGAYNWRRLRPALARQDTAAGRLRRTALAELALATVVLAITAVLTGLPRPGEAD